MEKEFTKKLLDLVQQEAARQELKDSAKFVQDLKKFFDEKNYLSYRQKEAVVNTLKGLF